MIDPPARPRVRALDTRWTLIEGQRALVIQDRLGLMAGALVAPAPLAVLLSLCDGTRDIEALTSSLRERLSGDIQSTAVAALVIQLDEALVFESERFEVAFRKSIDDYGTAPFRQPHHAGLVYAEDAAELKSSLDAFVPAGIAADTDAIRGVVSPHIDYRRGGPIYGATWERAREAARAADTILIFGTDHHGGPGKITPTTRDFRTPFGTLTTDVDVVGALADAIGPDLAFEEEFHHCAEHSIELAAVWLHWAAGGAAKTIVPILCGSFRSYTQGTEDPARDKRIEATIATLRDRLQDRRVLAVAAADLAHVGPAFGDSPFHPSARTYLQAQDEKSIAAICAGDPAGFFGELRAERDIRKYCGLPPIYLMLRFLGESSGELVAYEQCPADEENTSWVSVAGILLR